MLTSHLGLTSLLSIEKSLKADIEQTALRIATLSDSNGQLSSSPELSATRLKRSITRSVLHDVQSRIKSERTKNSESRISELIYQMYPETRLLGIPPEFKPEEDPSEEIILTEQARIKLYEKLESSGQSCFELEHELSQLRAPSSESEFDHQSKLQAKLERSQKYFEKQSAKILRTRKRLFNLYSRIPERKKHKALLSQLTAEQYESISRVTTSF